MWPATTTTTRVDRYHVRDEDDMLPRDNSQARRAVRATAICLVAVAVISGPLVGSVDLTRSHGGEYLVCNGGAATVRVTEEPAEFTLDAERFGAETFSFSGEDAVAHVEAVDGCPRLVYRLQVPALGFDGRRVHFLDEGDRGEVVLSPPEGRLKPDEVDQTAYEATVTIELQGDTREVLYRANVTIEVDE